MKRSVASLLLIAFPLAACSHWAADHELPIPVRDSVHTHDRAKVIFADGTEAVFENLLVRPDSLRGLEVGDRSVVQRSLARDEYTGVRPSEFHAGKTVLAVVGIGAGAVVLAGLLCAATDCLDFDMSLFGPSTSR